MTLQKQLQSMQLRLTRAGVSIREWHRRANVSQSTYYRLVSGEHRTCGVDTLHRLTQSFDVCIKNAKR